jgi:hypothetical protein
MPYLKIESGEVTKTIPNIRKEYSNVSFVGGTPNQEFLDLHKLVEVTPITTTHPNDKVEDVTPYKDGDKWYTQKVTPFVVPTPAATTEEQRWIMVRFLRYEKLRLCDYVVLEDSQVSNKDAWKTYRQALRDVPANNADPDNISWPTEPS